MKRIRYFFLGLGLFVCLAGLLWQGRTPAAWALTEPLWKITDVQGRGSLLATGQDQAREANTLMVYTSAFGASTRTNAFGLEVVLIPQNGSAPGVYLVALVRDTEACRAPQRDPSQPVLKCGNATIPPGGLVLSATGTQRDALLSLLGGTQSIENGGTLYVQPQWLRQGSMKMAVSNPTPTSNPPGGGFPGVRGSHQLIRYDAGYGQPTTGTNEYGFEVTVKNGVVVTQEGSDSQIPAEPNSFVLSGHGRARDWLVANAPVGARIAISDDGVVTARVDASTYAEGLQQLALPSQRQDTPIPPVLTKNVAQVLTQVKRLEALRAQLASLETQTAAMAGQTLDEAQQVQWAQHRAMFPDSALRGVWHRPVEQSRQEVGQTLDRLKWAGINAVFLETYFHGYPLFPSETFTNYGLAQNQHPWARTFQGGDPLAVWVAEAHKRGMKLHAWFQTFYAGSKVLHPPGPVLSRYPFWANKQRVAIKATQPTASNLEIGHYFLDPANPDVRQFLWTLLGEIASRYQVDGVQLDYIRYAASLPPNRLRYADTTWGYTPQARASFTAYTGIDPATLTPESPQWPLWNEWKAEQVTTFVETAAQQLRRLRPDIELSVAIFPKREESLVRKHQDWTRWAQAGWLDFVTPMTLTSATKVIETDAREAVAKTEGRAPIMAGVFGPFNQNTAETLLEQLQAARRAGVAGVVLFDSAHLSGRMLRALNTAWGEGASSGATAAVVETKRAKSMPPVTGDMSSPSRASFDDEGENFMMMAPTTAPPHREILSE
jgi:uncharacterized lipoprotein YddW (UPF0748 family)